MFLFSQFPLVFFLKKQRKSSCFLRSSVSFTLTFLGLRNKRNFLQTMKTWNVISFLVKSQKRCFYMLQFQQQKMPIISLCLQNNMVLKHLRLTGTSGKYSIGKNINYLLNNNLPRHLVNKAIFLRRPKEKGRKWQTFLGKVTFNDIYLGTLEVSEVI